MKNKESPKQECLITSIDSNSQRPLEGIKVLDLGCFIAGPLAGMLLADQGAEVVKIDPLTGPIFNHPVNEILNRNKALFKVDLKCKKGLIKIKELILTSDVFIENFSEGTIDKLGLSVSELKKINPELVVLSLPGFAKADNLAKNIKAYEGIIAAMTGQYTDIHPVRNIFGLDPVYTSLPLSSVYAAVHGVTATILALREKMFGFRTFGIETPLANASLSAMSSMYMTVENTPQRYETPRLSKIIKKGILPIFKYTAKLGPKMQSKILNIARKSYPALMRPYGCKDGALLYIFAIDNKKIILKLINFLKLEKEIERLGMVKINPYTTSLRKNNLFETSNLSKKLQKEIQLILAKKLKQENAIYWENKLSEAGIPCTLVRTTFEWLKETKLHEAGIVTSLEVNGKKDIQPGVQVWLKDVNYTYFAAKSFEPEVSFSKNNSPPGEKAARPAAQWLKELTVIDMCTMVAGPVSGRTLAEYGARVIKVESPNPLHGPRMTCWYGLDVNKGKESILIDLKTSEGVAAFHKLLTKADILLTNHSLEAMNRMGLSQSTIKSINSKLIYTIIGAYNGPKTSSWESRNGYDPVLQAASGIMERYGDTGSPELHAIASCVDALTGYSAALGVALALYRKEKLGLGATVCTSLANAATLVQIPLLSQKKHQKAESIGQQATGEMPFYRLYKASDKWIFIAQPNANIKDLPKELRPRLQIKNTQELATLIGKNIKKKTAREVIKVLNESGISSVEVASITEFRDRLSQVGKSHELSLNKTCIDDLGYFTYLGAIQLSGNNRLQALKASVKPGANTQSIINEFGLKYTPLIAGPADASKLTRYILP